jgi:hypothetical protein
VLSDNGKTIEERVELKSKMNSYKQKIIGQVKRSYIDTDCKASKAEETARKTYMKDFYTCPGSIANFKDQ